MDHRVNRSIAQKNEYFHIRIPLCLTITDKAAWYVHVVDHTAEALGKPIWETAKMMERSGLAQRVISGYDVWFSTFFHKTCIFS